MKTKLKKGSIDLFAVAPGVWGMKDFFVNVYMIKNDPAANQWWLVDTGVKWSSAKIKGMASLLFGEGSKPEAIILTHGHFDHVGGAKKLADEWNVPIYAHHLELPYLTGLSSYPPPDPAAGGGLMADLSFFYPKGPVNIEAHVTTLPGGGKIPGLPAWKYIHTPGHSAGHISLFRESDKVLIAGDAVVTIKAESAVSTIFQFRKLSGPPKYLTSDWPSSASSVEQLAALEPEIIASGHGRPMRGAAMRKSLHNLAVNFNKIAVPVEGRYTHQPALMDDSGVVHIPPKNIHASTAPTLKFLGISAAVLITVLLFSSSKKKKLKRKLKEAKYLSNQGKQETRNESKHLKATFVHGIEGLKTSLNKKSKTIAYDISARAEKLKDPAINMLEGLKFRVREKIK